MKEVTTLKDLMAQYLLSLHDAESQWSEAVKETAGNISSRELKKIFETSAENSAGHARKLKTVIDQLKKGGVARKNIIAKDLIREIRELQAAGADPEVVDAGLIVSHQCMNHYMIAKYGTVASFARLLQQENIAHTLHDILEEEKAEDEELTKLAEEKINVKAKAVAV